MQAIRDGVALLTWQSETFAYAESHDEGAARYRGLRGGQVVSLSAESAGLLVKPDLAQRQMDSETAKPSPGESPAAPMPRVDVATGVGIGADAGKPPGPPQPKRFHGTVTLDPTRVGRDSSRIAEEVIAHLVGLVGATVTVTLEIEAEIPSGAPDNVVRAVTENSRTLHFKSQGFERQ